MTNLKSNIELLEKEISSEFYDNNKGFKNDKVPNIQFKNAQKIAKRNGFKTNDILKDLVPSDTVDSDKYWFTNNTNAQYLDKKKTKLVEMKETEKLINEVKKLSLLKEDYTVNENTPFNVTLFEKSGKNLFVKNKLDNSKACEKFLNQFTSYLKDTFDEHIVFNFEITNKVGDVIARGIVKNFSWKFIDIS